jgi:hypothetical protein
MSAHLRACAICEADLSADIRPEELDVEDILICRKCIGTGLPDAGLIAMAELSKGNPQ